MCSHVFGNAQGRSTVRRSGPLRAVAHLAARLRNGGHASGPFYRLSEMALTLAADTVFLVRCRDACRMRIDLMAGASLSAAAFRAAPEPTILVFDSGLGG